jgi:RNA polymerase sigma-70 factor (ECF subfamily)
MDADRPLHDRDASPLDQAMNRYADGDDSAFSPLFAGLSSRLHAFFRRLGASEQQASDLTQETFLRMHQARGSFARGRGVVPWAYAIARNCYISSVRSTKARVTRLTLDITELDVAAGPEASAEETASARQAANVVRSALATMTEARREAFLLLRYEGLSVAEAARILGITEGAVKLRAFHAYEIVRVALSRMETRSPSAGREQFRAAR